MNILSVVALATALVFGSPATTTISDINVPSPTPISSWLEKLAGCESQNNPNAINQDDGGSPSYGYLQFKLDTFRRYSRQFGLFENTEDAEFANLVMDKDAQLLLATQIIEKDYAWQNWTNCVLGNPKLGVKSVGMPPRMP